MMPRKKRIAILVISIILAIFIILGILGFLYLKTDAFKSNENLFAKYFVQNFDAIEILKSEDTLGIENTLNTNKYTSELNGQIQYTENMGTSDENKNSNINNVGIKISSNIDKQNSYSYRDISIGTNEQDLVKFEYLNQDQTYGIRLNDIQQFVSIENNEQNEIIQEFGIGNIEGLQKEIDINSIFGFTEEEKQTLINTYMKIIQSNISKNKYYKQKQTLITVNNQDVTTNAYYIKLTIEEYNNLYIKILEQIVNDEIILSRIDLIENEIKEKYSDYNQDEKLREKFINLIREKIEKIQSTNIGSEEVKITVYEKDMKTVRTSIEKTTNKIIIDLYNDSSIKIDNVELGENVNEQFVKIERTNGATQSNLLVEFEQIKDNEVVKNIQLNYDQVFEDNKIKKTAKLEMSNEKYKGILSIEDNIELIGAFQDKITLDTDNVKLNDLQQDQIEAIKNILNENIQGQLSNLFSIVSIEDYTKMLQNLEIIKQNSIQIPDEGEVTDIERKRFNSQFEFFASENLTTDNIKDLLEMIENNFEEMKVLLKSGEIEELDLEKLEMNSEESYEYKNNISEILISIKQNTKNEQKQKDVLNFVENNDNDKYTVSLEYDDDGLVKVVRIKIQEN